LGDPARNFDVTKILRALLKRIVLTREVKSGKWRTTLITGFEGGCLDGHPVSRGWQQAGA
jgi:hypothetical protein